MLGSGPSIKGERARSNVNTLVILNPASGHGLGRKLRPRIERGLRDAGVRFDLVETTESVAGCLRLIDVASYRPGHHLELILDGEKGEAVAFLSPNP